MRGEVEEHPQRRRGKEEWIRGFWVKRKHEKGKNLKIKKKKKSKKKKKKEK